MLDITNARRLVLRTLLLLLPGLLALAAGWSLFPALYAQTPSLPACPPRTILFVAATERPPNEDKPLVNYLAGLGHQVDLKAAHRVQANDAQDKDLVIISESSLSTDIGNRLRNLSVPILTWEGWLLDDLKMASSQEYVDYGDRFTTTITLLAPQHPLAGGLSGQIQTTLEIDEFHWGVPGPNAVLVATTQQPPQTYLFAYEAGVPMVGLTAPARRVFIPNATGPQLTANGWTLFDAAVRWTSNCLAGETPTPTATTTPIPTETPTLTPIDTPTAIGTVEPTATTSLPLIPPTSTPAASPSPDAIATSTPTPSAPAGQLAITKRDFLFSDTDNNEQVSPGDTLFYAITILNDGVGITPQLRLADHPDPNTRLMIGSVKAIGGVIMQGNHAGDDQVVIEITPLISGAHATLSFQVVVNAQLNGTQIQNQAFVTLLNPDGQPSGQAPLVSDDPDTATPDDATITPLLESIARLNSSLFLPLIQKTQP